ncbi:MAG: type 1 glutamine amidotransferase [Phycisphaerales bacterium]
MAIVVLQHAESDGIGRLGPVLRDQGHALDIRRLDLTPQQGGRPVPPDYDNVSGVISLGGPMNVGDAGVPWMETELAYLKGAHERGLPLVGICLGCQLVAKALGGEVGPMDAPGEFGFGEVNITVPGQTETLMAGIQWTSRQWQAHGQEVKKLPDGAGLLASSKACKVQAWKLGLRTYGFQYHFESDRADIDSFLADAWSRQLMEKLGLSAGDVARQADEHYPTFERLGLRLAGNIATYLFPSVSRLKG